MSTSQEYVGRDLEAMSFASNYSKWIIDNFQPYLGHSVAEVGAGCGNLSRLLLSETKADDLTLFEPSANLWAQLNDSFSGNVKCNPINSTLRETEDQFYESFDSLLYVNVLEHIEDDAEEVRFMYRCLKKDGYVCIFVPALSWLYSDFDRSIGHFRRYHKDQLIHLFDSSGFNLVSIKYVDLFGILPWYIFFVLLGRQLDGVSTNSYDKLVVPVARIIESMISVPIGKNLLLIAKK